MTFFLRAVVTGFALSLGAALFKKISKEIGLGDDKEKDKEKEKEKEKEEAVRRAEGATDPLQRH